jgi:hypothetical protein
MSRFFPNGGNGDGDTHRDIKPGDIFPLFDKGYLKYDVRAGERYITLTEEAYKVIKNKDQYIYKDK